jgi:hypothetical protein
MSKATLVCLESDDLLHENSGETNFNESAYYNFYDPAVRLGGFVRLGNRATMVPLRNRRDGVTTRIAEGLTEWRWGERVGYGWSEYLDHVD